MADAHSPRLIGIRAEPGDVTQLAELFEQCPPTHGTALAVEQAQAETRLIIPIDFGARQFLYDLALDGRLWPNGIWSFSESDMREAVQLASHKSRPRILVRAAPANVVTLPPDSCDGPTVYDRLLEVEPTSREAGPGFDWIYFAEEDLVPSRQDQRSSELGLDRSESSAVGCLALPEPLVDFYRHLMADEVDRHAARHGEFQAFITEAPDLHEWYGLDLPGNARLWILVAAHTHPEPSVI